MKNVKHYAAVKGFIPSHLVKAYFEPRQFSKFFPGESHHSSVPKPIGIQTTKLLKRGYILCLPKSPGHTKDISCCFGAYYSFNTTKGTYMFSDKSNLSHNHELPSLPMTVDDGRTIVNLESHFTPGEFVSINEQSRCCISVPQMRVNLEDSLPDLTFSATMLYRMHDTFLKGKYGNDLHNLHGLFIKGDRI